MDASFLAAILIGVGSAGFSLALFSFRGMEEVRVKRTKRR